MKKTKIAYILVVTLVGIFYLYRDSINTYWAQTYHTDSPLIAIERWGKGVLDSAEPNNATPTEKAEGRGSAMDIETDISEAIARAEANAGNPQDADGDLQTNVDADFSADDLEALLAMGQSPLADSKDHVTNDDSLGSLALGSIAGIDASNEAFVGPMIPQLPSDVVVTAGDKLFFVGDSLMQGVAPRVRQSLYRSENIDGVDLSKQSTGLAYPNFYNWPKVVEETLNSDKGIKAVVVYLGANDPWDFPVPGRKQYLRFKKADWERVYRSRIQSIILSAKKHDLPVIWLGAPCMRKTKLHTDMVYLNTLYESEMAKFNGRYIPTSDILGCSDEKYNAYAETEKGNQKVRTNDGIHFTVAGQRLLAERIIEELTIIRDEPIDEPADIAVDEVEEGIAEAVVETTDKSIDKARAEIEVSDPVKDAPKDSLKVVETPKTERSTQVKPNEKPAREVSSEQARNSDENDRITPDMIDMSIWLHE